MKKLTVKVVGKEIKNDKTSFTSFSVMSVTGRWYRVAKIDVKELNKFKGEVATIDISRKFDKSFTNSKGEDQTMPTLVIEKIATPTEAELKEFNDAMDKMNNATLKDVI